MNKKIIIAITGVALFSAAVVVALYTQIFNPSWNPFADSPEQIIEETIENMKALESMNSDMELLLEVIDETTQQNFTVNINASTDTQESPNKTQGDFDINFAIEGMSFSLAGDTISIEKDIYLKLKTIPMLPFLAPFLGMGGAETNELKQWIKLENEDINGDMEEDKVAKMEMEQKIKDLFLNKKLYFVKETLSDGDDIGEYHYLVSLNKEECKNLLLDVLSVLREEYPNEGMVDVAEFDEEIKKGLDEFFEKIGDLEADIWIGKKNKLLHKIEFKKTIDATSFGEDKKGVINIEFKINFSKFNQNLNIEAPKEFKTIEEIFSVANIFENPAKKRANDGRVISDMAQMRIVAEIINDSEGGYANVNCNYGDVNILCDDIREMTGDKPIIHSSQNAYCAYIKLNSEKYCCIDHNLKRVETFTNPAKKGYCDGITFVCP